MVDDASVLAVATLIGAADIGAATALMNPRLTAGELAVLMDAAGTASTGVAGSAYAAVAAEAGLDPVLGTSGLLTGPGLDPAGNGRNPGRPTTPSFSSPAGQPVRPKWSR